MISHQIKFVDLLRSHERIRNEINKILCEVIDSSAFINGKWVREFETNFSHYIGTKYSLGVASGSDALYLGLNALGIGRGDEVIVPSFTFTSTVDAVVRNGATPVFVDIEDNYNISYESLRRAITKKTKAVIVVHLYGNPANMREIMEITHDKDITLIEDSAQAHGAEVEGRKAGSFGDLACFSFYPTKNLGGFGDGGAVCTNNDELMEKIIMLREYGQKEKYHHEFIGVNSRLDTLQAAILNIKLSYLENWNENRRRSARLYSEFLSQTNVVLPSETKDSKHVYHLYVIREQKRDSLKHFLELSGISTGIHYPIPVHLLNSYRKIGIRNSLEKTERFSREVISLPMFPFITEAEIEYVCQKVVEFKNSN